MSTTFFSNNLSIYGFFIGLATVLVILTITQRFKSVKSTDIIVVLIACLLGGRFFFLISVGSSWQSIRQIANLRVSGISLYGVFAGLVASSLYIIRLRNIKSLEWFDTLAVILPFAQAVGRIGNFFNQELFGYPTDLPWGIYIDPQNRPIQYSSFEKFHPAFLYEIVLNLLLTALLLLIKKKGKIGSGVTISVYAIGYGLIRIFVGTVRIDNVPVIAGGGWADIMSIILIITGLILLYFYEKSRRNRSKEANRL